MAGIAGAFLGSLPGAVCIVLVGQLGYVASICGLAMLLFLHAFRCSSHDPGGISYQQRSRSPTGGEELHCYGANYAWARMACMTFILPGLVGMLAVPALAIASSSDVLPTIPALGAVAAGLIRREKLSREEQVLPWRRMGHRYGWNPPMVRRWMTGKCYGIALYSAAYKARGQRQRAGRGSRSVARQPL